MLVVVLLVAYISTMGMPSWLAFVETRRLNAAQNEVYLRCVKPKAKPARKN